jgi:hypothetical protein
MTKDTAIAIIGIKSPAAVVVNVWASSERRHRYQVLDQPRTWAPRRGYSHVTLCQPQRTHLRALISAALLLEGMGTKHPTN